MSIPSTPVLDAFDRADGPLGANWTTRVQSLQIIGQAVTGSSVNTLNSAYWNASSFGPDSEVYVSVPVIPAATINYIRLHVRLANPAAAGETGYMASWQPDGTNGLRIFAETSLENFTLIAQDTAATYTTGDQLALRAVGSTISAYKNGVLAGQATDTSFANAGFVALGCRDITTRLDSFGGGTIVPAGSNVILPMMVAGMGR